VIDDDEREPDPSREMDFSMQVSAALRRRSGLSWA
jgi:hypothetical protein